MKRNLLTAIALVTLCIVTLIVTLALSVNTGRAQRNEFESPQLPPAGVVKPAPSPPSVNHPLSTDCAIQPDLRPVSASRRRMLAAQPGSPPMTLSRFRRLEERDRDVANSPTRRPPDFTPREAIVLIDPTNYGDRFLRDVNGQPVNNPPLVVLHETVASASSTINFFRTPHLRDADQASYHTLIRRDGTVIYLVPPDKRAFGAGNSIFRGDRGIEAVKTHPKFPPSVNNFAYHISLETPGDGINNASRHSGYTEAQYQSLAWLVAQTGVIDNRITTHKAVDRSESRMDPRSFQFSRFFQLLQTYPKTNAISLQCTVPPELLSRRSARPKKPQTAKRKPQVNTVKQSPARPKTAK